MHRVCKQSPVGMSCNAPLNFDQFLVELLHVEGSHAKPYTLENLVTQESQNFGWHVTVHTCMWTHFIRTYVCIYVCTPTPNIREQHHYYRKMFDSGHQDYDLSTAVKKRYPPINIMGSVYELIMVACFLKLTADPILVFYWITASSYQVIMLGEERVGAKANLWHQLLFLTYQCIPCTSPLYCVHIFYNLG